MQTTTTPTAMIAVPVMRRPQTGLIWLAGLLIALFVLLWVAGTRERGRSKKSSSPPSPPKDTTSRTLSTPSPPDAHADNISSRRVHFDTSDDRDQIVEYDPESPPAAAGKMVTSSSSLKASSKKASRKNASSDTMAGDTKRETENNVTSASEDITMVDGVAVTQAGKSKADTMDSTIIGPQGQQVLSGTNIMQDDAFSYVDMPPDADAVSKQGMPRSYWDKEYGDKVREENKDYVDLPPLPTHEQHMKAVRRMPAKQMMSGRTPNYSRTKGECTNIRDLYQPLPQRKTSGLALHGMTESYFAAMEDKEAKVNEIASMMSVESAFV